MLLQESAKLLLRIVLGALVLVHGIHKIKYGIDPILSMLSATSFPQFLAYGVYVGEVIAPIFVLLGFYAKTAAGVIAFNMLMAIFLAYGPHALSLNAHGGLVSEQALVYLMISIVIMLLGSGKFAINNR